MELLPNRRKYSPWALFFASFTSLYVEIMLIRWLGTEVRIFAYFQNITLIASFLGFGLGCYLSKKRISPLFSIIVIAVLVAFVQNPYPVSIGKMLDSNWLQLSPDASLWGFMPATATASPGVLIVMRIFGFAGTTLLLALFLLFLVAVMFSLGQAVAGELDAAPNVVRAYSLNLLGSILGIWIFAVLAFFSLAPVWWFLVALAALFFMELITGTSSKRHRIVGVVVSLVALAILVFISPYNPMETIWSPYQKLQVYSFPDHQYSIEVNNTGYMSIANFTPAYLSAHPEVKDYYKDGAYDAPFYFAANKNNVLVLGAGAGNDVAGALRNGAGHVDAVEIDPVIYKLGSELHPERPYSSPVVDTVITDARAYMRGTNKKYDVVILGLLDSQTEFSNYSNMRIDNYVYTEESFKNATRLLNPSGIFVLKFEVREPWTWMGLRFYSLLTDVFGRPPVVFHLNGPGEATVFIDSRDPSLFLRAAGLSLADFVAKHPPSFELNLNAAPPVPTDDWPYVYNHWHSIPTPYFTVSLILLTMAVVLFRKRVQWKSISSWNFFLLGGGFLLLETQMISRLALYFGTTWLVSAIVITFVLFVLVLANFFVTKFQPRRLLTVYALLAAFLMLNYFFPWESLPYGAKTIGTLMGLAYSMPLFFAGIIFAKTFERAEHKAYAFGANIVGSVAGGLAENLSFIVGMKALLVIALVFYAAAAWCFSRKKQ